LCHKGKINTPRTLPLHVYIRMGSTRGAATSYYQQLVPQGRNIHPGTWHSSMYQNGIYTVPRLATSSLCHKGEIYTQGHGIPPYISEWDSSLPTSSLCHKGEIYTRTWHSSMYISEWDLHRCCHSTTQLVARNDTQGHGIPPCISEWDLHGALLLLPAACATREKYTRDMVFLHVYQNISAATTTQQLVPQGEIYTQDSILHAYIVKGRNIHPGIMAFLHVYIRMGSTRCCH
jgi:hypothetical protein